MLHTTLCYIEKDGAYLLLHRVKKKEDVNAGKWVGIGGKLEAGETPEACLLREVREETGLALTDYRFVGEIFFSCPPYPDEVMHLYHATAFSGEVIGDCAEGNLSWVGKKEARALPMWEGDRLFLEKLGAHLPPFTPSLVYEGGHLASATFSEYPLNK